MIDSQFTHEALVYEDEEQFCATALPFLREGLAAGELVCVVTGHNELLRQALGADAERVAFLDAGAWFARPGDTFAAYQRFIDEDLAKSGASARVLAEAVWADRSRAEVAEWQRLEAAINVVFADAPLRVACCYDQRRAPAELQTAAAQTHPHIHDGDGRQAYPAYLAPETFIDQLERHTDLPAPPADSRAMPVNGNFADLRAFVRAAAERTGMSPDRADDVVLVANELATNLVRHSAGQGQLLMWASDGQLVCELRDPAGNRPPPLAGYAPPGPEQASGYGLTVVRQLADLVNVGYHSEREGSAVRVTFAAS